MEALARGLDLFVHVAFWTLLHSLWQGALLAASLAIWRKASDERDAAARCAASTLTLIFLAVAPLVTAGILATTYRPPTDPPAEEFPLLLSDFEAFEPSFDEDLTASASPEPSVNSYTAPTLTEWIAYSPHAIAFCWALGVAWGGARLAGSAARLTLVRRGSTPASDSLAARCRALATRCGLSRAPSIVCSPSAKGPYAFGLWRPCVVLPAAWVLATTPEVLEAAIAHELAHLRRRDLWVLALQRFVETTFFFHPGVWYVSRTLDAERERDADRLAAEILGDPARYAESLCRLASLVDAPALPALAVPFQGETRMKLLERVRHVLRTEESRRGASLSVGWLCLAPAVLAAVFFGQAAVVGSLQADDEPERSVVDGLVEETEFDAVVLDQLLAHAERSQEADEATELRRLYLDLAGVLPTPEAIADFVDDDSLDKRESVIRDLAELIVAQQQDDRDEGRRDEGRRDEEDDDEDDEDDEDDDEDDEDDDEGSVADLRRRFEAEKEALSRAIREEAEKIEAIFKERRAQLEEEMIRARRQLEEAAQQKLRELELRMAQAAQAREESRDRPQEAEEEEAEDEDLTPRERRLMGIIRALEARLREVEGRGSRGEWREDREEAEDREGAPREERREGDRPREREEGDGEDGNLKESDEQEAQEREADERNARRAPRSEEEALQQQRDHFAERLYGALRGEGIAEDRKPEFVRRAILDVLGLELNDDQVRMTLERSKGEFEGFRELVARLASIRREEAENREETRAEERSEETPREEGSGEQEPESVDQFAERLFDALRGGMSEEQKPEFVRNEVGKALDFELNEAQLRIVIDAARRDLDGFRRLIVRISNANE